MSLPDHLQSFLFEPRSSSDRTFSIPLPFSLFLPLFRYFLSIAFTPPPGSSSCSIVRKKRPGLPLVSVLLQQKRKIDCLFWYSLFLRFSFFTGISQILNQFPFSFLSIFIKKYRSHIYVSRYKSTICQADRGIFNRNFDESSAHRR